MNQKDTVIVSIDFQERLVPAMVDSKPMIEEAVKLLKGANILGIPVLFTQQYTLLLLNRKIINMIRSAIRTVFAIFNKKVFK